MTDLGENPNLDKAQEWFRDYYHACFDIELVEGVDSDWIKPFKITSLSDTQRLIYSLGQFDGKAEQNELIGKFNELFDTNKRSNNTRRIVNQDKQSLFDLDKSEKIFMLTSRGMSYYRLLEYLLKIGCLKFKKNRGQSTVSANIRKYCALTPINCWFYLFKLD